jgi:lipoic acid synthetase
MVGLGETSDQVSRLLGDLLESGCRLVTVGQYLRPAEENLPVVRYWEPEEFASLEEDALSMGFDAVAAAPLVRSSYFAYEML